MTTIPGTLDYSLDSNHPFFKAVVSSYNNLYKNKTPLDPSILNQILGFGNTSENQSNNLIDLDTVRTQNFFNFWNKSNDFFDTGDRLNTYADGDYQGLYDRNNIVTYILLLVFKGIMSSRDGVNLSNPVNIFTEPSDYKDFCKASENLQQFMRGAEGLGNFPVFPSTPSESQVKDFWNNGFLNNFCNQQFAMSCKDGKVTDKCIEDYRTMLANKPIALSWCGCFTPLPSWEKDTYDVNIKIPKQTCDNFCFNPRTIGYYYPPLVGNSQPNASNRIECNATVCIIDDNKINAVDTNKTVDFNQICPCKPPVPCTCYINVSKPGVLDKVKSGDEGVLNQEAFKQDCKNALCYIIDDATGEKKSVKCNAINTPATGSAFRNNVNGLTESKEYDKIYSNFWDFILLIIFVLIFFELAYIEVHRYMQRSKTL